MIFNIYLMQQISFGASDDGMIIGVILVMISCRSYLVQFVLLQVSAAFFLFPSEVEVEVSFRSTVLVSSGSSSSSSSLFVFLDTSDTLAMFLCHRTLILLNNLKTGELDLKGL